MGHWTVRECCGLEVPKYTWIPNLFCIIAWLCLPHTVQDTHSHTVLIYKPRDLRFSSVDSGILFAEWIFVNMNSVREHLTYPSEGNALFRPLSIWSSPFVSRCSSSKRLVKCRWDWKNGLGLASPFSDFKKSNYGSWIRRETTWDKNADWIRLSSFKKQKCGKYLNFKVTANLLYEKTIINDKRHNFLISEVILIQWVDSAVKRTKWFASNLYK